MPRNAGYRRLRRPKPTVCNVSNLTIPLPPNSACSTQSAGVEFGRIWGASGSGMNYLMFAIAIVAEVCGTTAMKQSDGFTRMAWTVVTVVGYGIAFHFLSLTLRTIPTGIASHTQYGPASALS